MADVPLAMKKIAALMVVAAAVVACASPTPSPVPTKTHDQTPTGSPAPVSQSPTATPPAETVACVPEAAPTASIPADPCPLALAAIRNAVARFQLPIGRIVLQPEPFECGALWPGVASPLFCPLHVVLTGTTMHGWVGFTGSAKIAAVSLHFQPASGASPVPSPTWTTFVAAFQVPPAGWVMP